MSTTGSSTSVSVWSCLPEVEGLGASELSVMTSGTDGTGGCMCAGMLMSGFKGNSDSPVSASRLLPVPVSLCSETIGTSLDHVSCCFPGLGNKMLSRLISLTLHSLSLVVSTHKTDLGDRG